MALNFTFRDIEGDFGDAINASFEPIKQAATWAIRDVAEIAKQNGRAEIARAGFNKKFQFTLRSKAYPERGFSADASAWIYHILPYAGVFEDGATIRGRPIMWLPFDHTPLDSGRGKLRPKKFRNYIGSKLVSMRNGRKPLLGAPMLVSRAEAKKGPPYKVTRAKLRAGASETGIIRTVPVYHGVSTVTISKKFNLKAVFDDAAAQLPQLYVQNLRL